MSQVSQLYQLQEMDSEIDEKKQRLGEVLKLLKGPPALVTARQQVEEAAGIYSRHQSNQNKLSQEIQILGQKAKSMEDRLYSGNVKNPKELEDMQHSLEGMRRQRAVLEDEMLEVMILVEEAGEVQAEAEAEVAVLEEKWMVDRVRLEAEKGELAGRLGVVMAARQTLAARVPDALLKQYDSLRARKGGTAVVRVRGDDCLGCRITISAIRLREAREGHLVFCDGCGRILYPYN